MAAQVHLRVLQDRVDRNQAALDEALAERRAALRELHEVEGFTLAELALMLRRSKSLVVKILNPVSWRDREDRRVAKRARELRDLEQ